MKIVKIALLCAISCGVVANAGVKEQALVKLCQAGDLTRKYGLLGTSLGLMGVAMMSLDKKDGKTFLNEKLNFGTFETLFTGAVGVVSEVAKRLPKIGGYLDNNFAQYALISLAANRIMASIWFANFFSDFQHKMAAKLRYEFINKSWCKNTFPEYNSRMYTEKDRLNSFLTIFAAGYWVVKLSYLYQWAMSKYALKK